MSQALLALINQRKNQVSGVKTIKPALGRNRYRILPSWRVAAKAPAHLSDQPGADGSPSEKAQWLETFYADFGQHFLKDAAGKVVAVALCPEKTFGKPCQVCDELHRGIQASTNDVQNARLKDALSGASILLGVLALDSPTPNQPEILTVPPSVFNGKKGVGGIISLFQDWPKLVALGGAADGCADIIIEKAGAGKEGTTYSVAAVPSSIVLTQAMLAGAKDIDAYIASESNPQSTTRALSSVAAVSGLLPAPQSPALLGAAAAAFAAAPATAQTPLTDVPDFPSATTEPVVQSTVPGATQVLTTASTPAVDPNAAVAAAQAALAAAQAAAAAQAPAPTPAVAATPAPAPAAAASEPSLEDLLKDL